MFFRFLYNAKQVEAGKCSFFRRDEYDSDYLFARFGPNAANFKLPIFKTVFVTANGRTVAATINDEVPSNVYAMLDISREVAHLLDIKSEGYFPCKITKESGPSILQYVTIITIYLIVAALLNN